MRKSILLFLVLLSVFSFKLNQGWSVEPGCKVTFSIGFWAGTCNGNIGGVKGNINFDADDLTKSFFNIGFDVNTINTDNGTRDGHLKKEEARDPVNALPVQQHAATEYAENYFAQTGQLFLRKFLSTIISVTLTILFIMAGLLTHLIVVGLMTNNAL